MSWTTMLALLLASLSLSGGWGSSEEPEEEQMISKRSSGSSHSWVLMARLEERLLRCCGAASVVHMR